MRLPQLLPDQLSDRSQFLVLLAWLELGGGVIGAAALISAFVRGWIGGWGLAIGLVLLPAALFGLAMLVFGVVGGAAGQFIQALTGAGNLPAPVEFSAEEALVMQGRVDEAVAALEARLAGAPDSVAIRFALAAIHRDHRRDFAAAERLYRAVRELPGASRHEDAVSHALVALYERTGDRGRLMTEYARFAARHAGTPPGDAARRRLVDLKKETPLSE